MYKSAYLIGNLLLAIIWLVLFFKRKDLRKEQLFVSIISGIFAPITDYFIFYGDYWRPEYLFSINLNGVHIGFESPLCGFLIGGITAILYESFFRKRQSYSKPRNFLGFVILVSILLGMILLNKLGINSVWASSITLLVSSLVMILIDGVLIKDAIWSSILFTILVFGLYSLWFFSYPEALNRFWLTGNMSGSKFGLIPIEELIWFFSAGTSLGILYEFWRNVKKYSKKR
ncbi:MAG: lycopene cyclase domain-containing protein [Microgenomates group bacterium]